MNGKEPAGPEWEAYKAVVRSIGNGGKILMVHKEAPEAARIALLRGIGQLLEDKEFIRSAQDALEGYSFVTGDALRGNIDEIGRISPSTIAWLRELLAREFSMKFEN